MNIQLNITEYRLDERAKSDAPPEEVIHMPLDVMAQFKRFRIVAMLDKKHQCAVLSETYEIDSPHAQHMRKQALISSLGRLGEMIFQAADKRIANFEE